MKDLAAEGDLLKRANLDLDVVPVFRNLLGQRGSLLHNDRGEPKHGKEGDQHCETHGCDPAHPQSAKPTDRGRQQKAQQHRKCSRDNNVASEVQECDNYPCRQDGQHLDKAKEVAGPPQPWDRGDGCARLMVPSWHCATSATCGNSPGTAQAAPRPCCG
jgi:hypothetical protein